MGNKAMDTSLFDRAAKFAIDAHANTERRGKGFPYIIHVMEAAEIVSTITSDQELLAAAMLHDVVEDTDVTEEMIRKEFGDRIADLVAGESDPEFSGLSESESWVARKQFVIDRLAKEPRDGKIVALGDKLSNMRAIARDFNEIGDQLWDRFHAPDPKLHKWHYEGLALALGELDDTAAYHEFVDLINDVFARAFKDEIAEIRTKAKPVSLDDWVAFGDGYTAVSYNHKTDPDIMMKLYAPFVDVKVIMNELNVAQAVLDSGVPTPQPLDFVVCGDQFGCTFRRVQNKRSIARAMSEEPENTEKYAVKFARMCKNLHSRKADTKIFKPISKSYKALVGRLTNFTTDEKLKIIDFLDGVEDPRTCIHGDLHCGNALITDKGEEFFIDLSDFCYGNPLFDLGTAFFTSNLADPDLMMRLFHCDKAQMRRYWVAFAKEYFSVESAEEIAKIDEMMKPYAAMKMIFFGEQDHWYPGMKEQVCELFGI